MIEVEIWVFFCLFQSYFYVYEFRVLVSRCFFASPKMFPRELQTEIISWQGSNEVNQS